MSVIIIVYFPPMAVCDFYGPQFNNLLLTDIKRFLSSCTHAFGDSIECITYTAFNRIIYNLD